MTYPNRPRWIAILLSVVLIATAASAAQETPAPLTLQECIIRAVRHNLDVAVQVYGSEMADLAVSRAGEKFLPGLSFNYGKQNQNSPAYSWIDAAGISTSSYMSYETSLNQKLPTGGTLSLSLNTYKNDTNARFQTINPRYGSTLNLGFTQPLLRDFGFRTSRKEILVARNNRGLAESDLRNALLETVASVERTYWEFVYSIESLKVRRQSLALAEDLLEKSRKEVAIGTLAPKEILSAQAEVAARKAEILQAEAQVKDWADTLGQLMNLPPDVDAAALVPADRPPFEKREMGVEEAFALALENRPDLKSSALNVANREIDLSFARNQGLPALNLNANYWGPGVSGDQILYFNNDPLSGIIVGKVPGGASSAMRDALGLKYRNWSVSLSLDVPLNVIFSRAAQAEARAARDRQIVQMKNLEQKALLEVRTSVRAVATDYERVGAFQAARELAEQKLAAEEAKLKAGLTQNFFILQYQRDLAGARMGELRALIDYTLSISRLEKATGTGLDRRNIKITDATEIEQ
ncbi:MAG: TolC family protein [Candidatus Aminicenantales bacterium]